MGGAGDRSGWDGKYYCLRNQCMGFYCDNENCLVFNWIIWESPTIDIKFPDVRISCTECKQRQITDEQHAAITTLLRLGQGIDCVVEMLHKANGS